MTTSNIHFGLAAWTSGHAYSIGNRVNSNGNAYQAINAATSGATAPSGTGASFSDGAVNWKYLSAVDYTSVQAWANAIPSTLTSNIIGLLWNDAAITTTVGTPFFVLGTSGAQRTTGSFSITLTPAVGESFRDKLKGSNTALTANSANGVTFLLPSSGAGNVNYIDIYDKSVVLDGIQFIDPNSTSNCTIINSNSNTTTTLSHCIVDGYAQDAGATMVAAQAPITYTNCLFVDRQATGSNGTAAGGGDSGAVSIVINNTFIRINPTNGTEGIAAAFLANTSPSIVSNNIFIGYTYPVGGSGNAALVDHCAMTSATVGFSTDNGNNIYNITASSQFVSATTDFRLKLGSVALNAGVTASTYIPAANDILGYARPQGTAWSLGAAEFTGQFTGISKIGPLKSTANITAVNSVSATKSIGTIAASAAIQQNVSASLIKSIGTISVVVAATQSNVATSTRSIGTITASGIISNNTLSAQLSIIPSVLATAVQFQTATSLVSIGAIAASGTAIFSNAASASNAFGPVTSTSTALQEDLVTSVVTIGPMNSGSSSISQSIIDLSALLTIPLTLVAQAAQINSASATVTIGVITPVITSIQSDITTSINSIGITPAITMLQENRQTSLNTFAITPTNSTMRQEKSLTAAPSIGTIALSGTINTTYNLDLTISIGTFSATGVAGQTAIASLLASIGGIKTANTTLTNPIPVTGVARIGPVASNSTFGAENIISAVATIAPIACIGSDNALLFATGNLSFNADSTASNPIPATAVSSIAPISTAASFENLAPLNASSVSLIGPLTTQSNAKQENIASSLITLIVTPIFAVANAPNLRVSQATIETLANGGNLRVSQTSIETLANGGNLRVSQALVEVLVQSSLPSSGRVSQVIGEVLAIGAPRALASQVVQEVLTGGSVAQNVRMTQVVTEILTGGSTTQNVFMTQVVLETLISAVPLPTIGTTYIAI